jgi:hypothetical protein
LQARSLYMNELMRDCRGGRLEPGLSPSFPLPYNRDSRRGPEFAAEREYDEVMAAGDGVAGATAAVPVNRVLAGLMAAPGQR